MKPNTNPSSIRLQDDIKIWILQQAFKEDRSLSNMVNKLLKDCKDKEETSDWRKRYAKLLKQDQEAKENFTP